MGTTYSIDEALLARIVAALKAAGASEVFVFGSSAHGRWKPTDLDLAVAGLPADQFFRVLGEVLALARRPVDMVDLDRDTTIAAYLRGSGELRRVG